MKRFAYTLLIVALGVGIMAGGVAFNFGRAQPELQAAQPTTSSEPMHTVSVSGTGQVSAQPDQATVRLGVQTQAESAQDALQSNNQQMQDVVDALKNGGVADQDIQTQAIRLQPRYQSSSTGNTTELVGYTATNVVQVTIHNLENLGQLLDTAVSAGGNTIENISFDISDKSDLLDQARQAAVNDARHKAEQLASLTDSSLGSVLTISETSQIPTPVGLGAASAVQEQAVVPIQPGTQNIQVDVQATWLLQVSQGSVSSASSAAPSVSISPTSGSPGTELAVSASGFPPNTQVEIGVGRQGSEYDVAATLNTDDSGAVSTNVEIPTFAQSGESWVVVVALTNGGVLGSNEKSTSNVFEVTP